VIESHDRCLGEVFQANNYLFVVPNYQRYFVWEQKEVKSFIDDCIYCYEAHQNGTQEYQHFLGQIILRKTETDRADRSIMEIIDGQQRLTTFTLLIMAAFRHLTRIKENADEGTQEDIVEYLTQLKNEYIVSVPQIGGLCRKLKLSHVDNPILMQIANTCFDPQITVDEASITKLSQKRIYDAYNYILGRIESKWNPTEAANNLSLIKDFINKISVRLRVVLLKTTRLGYNYSLYQIVNDRGVSLTAAELLKARTMELLYNNTAYASRCEDIWKDILNDDGQVTQKYLSWHYTSLTHKTAPRKDLNYEYEEFIFECKGKHSLNMDEQRELFNDIQDLHKSVELCRHLSNGTFPRTNNYSDNILNLFNILIKNLKNESCIPLFINIAKMENERGRHNTFEQSAFEISKFFFVAKSICNIHANFITKGCNEISKKVKSNQCSHDTIKNILSNIIEQKQCMTKFNSTIESDIYSKVGSNTTSLFLLYMLEIFNDSTSYQLNDFKRTGDNARIIDFNSLSNEHIFAQGLATTEEQQSFYNKIGNLTLLGTRPNNVQDNAPYEQKRETYRQSPYAITRAVAQNESWTHIEFNARQSQLVNKIKNIFIF